MALTLLAALVGCRSTVESWDPQVDLSDYESVVVEDFAYGRDPELGRGLAEQLAAELKARGLFEEVLRDNDGRRALVVRGIIDRYEPGNVANRIKFGRGLGEASLRATIDVREAPSARHVGTLRLDESTLQTGPDASRTGRETGRFVQEAVVQRIADELARRRGT